MKYYTLPGGQLEGILKCVWKDGEITHGSSKWDNQEFEIAGQSLANTVTSGQQ